MWLVSLRYWWDRLLACGERLQGWTWGQEDSLPYLSWPPGILWRLARNPMSHQTSVEACSWGWLPGESCLASKCPYTAMNLIAYATFPASSLVIHDITAPFAEALDTIRLVIAAFYFTYEAIIMIVAFYQMEAAILHNMFQSADLAGTMYSVFLAGHYITVALVLVDIFFCTFSGRLQQWWAHISGGLQERILWGVVAVAHTYMLYVWAAAAWGRCL